MTIAWRGWGGQRRRVGHVGTKRGVGHSVAVQIQIHQTRKRLTPFLFPIAPQCERARGRYVVGMAYRDGGGCGLRVWRDACCSCDSVEWRIANGVSWIWPRCLTAFDVASDRHHDDRHHRHVERERTMHGLQVGSSRRSSRQAPKQDGAGELNGRCVHAWCIHIAPQSLSTTCFCGRRIDGVA